MAWLKTEGRFKFRVKRTNKTIRENANGKPYVFLALEVAEGPNKGEEAEWKGYLNGGAFDITCRNLEQIFFGGVPFSDFYGLDEGRVSLIDRIVEGDGVFEVSKTDANKSYFRVNLAMPEDVKASTNTIKSLSDRAQQRIIDAAENAKPVSIAPSTGSAEDLPF